MQWLVVVVPVEVEVPDDELAAVASSAPPQAAGVPCAAVHSVSEHPYEEIVRTAHDEGCDVIFMASHGRRGIQALIMGGETHKVLTHTKIPVLVFR